MTDEPHDPGADEVDLLIAAYVDGVATPDERARVEADPELMDMVARHEEVKSILGDVPHVSESRRELIIAAALAAYRTSRSADGDKRRRLSETTPRERQHHDSRGARMRWIGTAAAVIAAVGGLAVLASTLDQGEDDSAPNEPSSAGADTTNADGRGGDRAEHTQGRQAPAATAAGSTGTTAAAAGTTTPDGDQSTGATTPASHAPGEEDTGYAEGPLARAVREAGQTHVCAIASGRETRFSFAARFTNDDDDAITIENVSLDALNGLRLVGVAFDPSSAVAAEKATGYPPAEIATREWDRLTMALDNGVTIDAGDDARLVLGFELERSTAGTARGVRIRYAQDGRTFEVVLDRTFAISKQCAPPGGG